MKNEITQNITIGAEEIDSINKATKILKDIANNLFESSMLDGQLLPKSVEYLITAALWIERKRVWSIFNCLNPEGNEEISKELVHRLRMEKCLRMEK